MEEGHLYIMENTLTKNLKIGISAVGDPRIKRVKQLNSGTKSDGEIRCIKTIKTPYYEEAERILHKIFRKNRVRGEWFSIGTDEVVALMLLTPAQIIQLIDAWKVRQITSLSSLMNGDSLFYEGKKEYLDHIHETNDRLIAEKTEELCEIKKQKEELEKKIQAINFYKAREESPTASVVRAALSAIPPPGSSQKAADNEDKIT